MSLKKMQQEQDEWSKRNFPNKKAYQPILGAVEELGELSHSYLKMEQGIRGTQEEHEACMKDAVSDCVIFLMDFCNQMGWDLEDMVQETWDYVKQRDWKKDKTEGGIAQNIPQ